MNRVLAFIAFTFCSLSTPAADFSAASIGPSPDGSLSPIQDGYAISSRGKDIGGTADDFEFGYELRTGDFDVAVRLEKVTITDAFVHAGLMARASLNTNSAFAAVFSSSALLGAFFESRNATGSSSQQVSPPSGFPVNYPEMYLRLRRTGNAFTGYASFDGKAWQQLGTATLSLPSQVRVGMAVASLNPRKISTATFRDIHDVVDPQTFTYSPAETLGPSSRRTGLVFSEIMYNPRPNSAGENLEFIELFNAESVFVDLSGWRIDGGVKYTFPDGFRLESGEFVVVAADPVALQRVYGLSGVLGPYSGKLNNSGETLKLLNRAGAMRLEIKYDRNAPWPVAADGAGHSLVLAHPSYGEDDPRAWAASEVAGGSPGEVDARRSNAWHGLVFNEVMSDGGNGFIELYNANNASLDLSGCVLTDDPKVARFKIPAGTSLPARSFKAFTQGDLKFALSRSGQTLYLFSPNLDRVLDGIRPGGLEQGVSYGRTPDGSAELHRLVSATQGNANTGRRIEEVVINEIMYDPITGNDGDSYVELFNRSANEVDLSGWKMLDGIDYELPEGAKLAAGGYLVVAKDAAHLIASYPQLNATNTFGNFSGNLSHSGERITLAKRELVASTNALNAVVTNIAYVPISQVAYVGGGKWPELAHGGGPSLELIDARSDSGLAANWAASDESKKAPWTTVEVTSKVELGSSAYPANRLQVLMLGGGECLVDDIELIPAGSTNIVLDGDFEAATSTWKFFGNHSLCGIEPEAAFSGNKGLHVRTPGDGDTANNTIRVNLARSLPTSGTATLRAKVRWLAGWPEILFRVRGNWIELPARMEVPATLGTPGLPNSRRIANAPPAIYDVSHSPALPRAGEAVVVTCRISDPDGTAPPRLRFRLDPAESLSTLTMRDDGFGGDALAGDGVYSATIGGRSARALVAFRIEATDDSAQSASSLYPPEAPARECLIRWDDTVPFGTFAHYHMWSTAATESARSAASDLDNTYRDATLVYGNSRVIYNVGFRDKGSPYHRGGGDFAVTTPADEPLLGVSDRVFASTGNGGNEGTAMKGDVACWIGEQLGIPFLHSHYMRLYRNGPIYQNVMYDLEQPNRYFAKSWYGSGGVKDDLFKIALWFEFDDSNSNFNSTGATLQRFLSGGEYKLARYRWNWQIRPGTDTVNDYSTIYALAAAANNASDRINVLPQIADMEEWMRVFAYHRVTGNWDSYTYNVGQNMYLYTPLGQRATLLPWDIDFVLGEGDNTTASTLFKSTTDTVMNTVFNLAVYKRMLWRAYQDAVNGPLVSTKFQPQIDARRSALTRNGVSASAPTSITTYMNGRRNYLVSQLRADAGSFYITSNNGEDFSSTSSSVSLTGVAPFAVASIEVNGVNFPITWTGVTNWQITVPLNGRTNLLEIAARDLRGQMLTGAVDRVTVRYDGVVPQVSDWVVINEINYHPALPNAEFVELHNRHPSFAFDLSGLRLEGVDYQFPSGTLIQPDGYVVVVHDAAGFAAAYGASIPALGPYGGKLQGNGETLQLFKPGGTANAAGTVIDEVRYSNAPPWPTAADGFGPSLQLIDAAQDNWRAANWGTAEAGTSDQATPGRPNSVRSTLDPFPKLWLNETQPNNLAGIEDNHGQKEPWIELYNAENSALDLAGFYLSDDPSIPNKWQFPAGARIEAGEFLLVWADAEPENGTGVLHTNFRLSATNGIITLSRPQNGGFGVVDYLSYQATSPQNTYGSYPDGDPRHRRMLFTATPGAPNSSLIPEVQVAINEWMAASQAVNRDPADGQFQDWFELYNAGTNIVDLSGYYLTDSESDKTQFQIPLGYKIGPKEFRLIWADNEPQQNAPGRDLHVNFGLRAEGEQIALFTPNEDLVTIITFGPQTANISEGLYPDGASASTVLFTVPTPGGPNSAQFANRRPLIVPIPTQTVDEGQLLSYAVRATDADLPPQALIYSLLDAPTGARIDPQTGQFSWTPNEAQGPGNYSVVVQVTDNGTPLQSATTTLEVVVREVNAAPSIAPIAPLMLDEGVPFSLSLVAGDPDLPAQQLSFALDDGSPVGTAIDPETGEFTWTPTEDQGPGTYTIGLRVTDDGRPPLNTHASFTVTVRDVNNPPVIEEIPVQTIAEGSLFALQVNAHDPETPPVKLTYSLDEAPAGMQINSDTGLISWIPGEADGPHDYNVVVRVSEPAGGPSTVATFLLGVSEVNVAPTLQAIADVIAQPGDSISIAATASDSDLPAQVLSFRALGDLPPRASLSPSTGVFSWDVPRDPQIGTNRITVEVSDDATPALRAQQSFNLVVRAPLRVAINEIMHRPKVENAEYIELANYSAVTAADLSGWRLEGYAFTFPSGTLLQPGEFLCVARNAAVFRATYGSTGKVLGDATIAVPASGGLLRLIKPGAAGFPDSVIDEVGFSLNAPWPGDAASSGASLQLINPWSDHRRVSNWGASATTSANPPEEILPVSATWKYWQKGTLPGDNWTNPAFDDAAWPSGGALLYVESSALPAAKVTSLELGQLAYYFRTHFNFAGNLNGATLRLSTVIDDGAVFYLNGEEIYRLGMPAGAISPGTLAARTVGNAANEGPFEVPARGLRSGENVLAVEVHQVNATSSDIVLGAALEATTLRTVSYTPGAQNAAAAPGGELPPVWINELSPVNISLVADRAGDFDPWLELYNGGVTPVDLAGWSLSDDLAKLGKWSFPQAATIAPGGHVLVWLDGETGESTREEWHAGFRAVAENGIILLSAQQNGAPVIVDYAAYGTVPGNQSLGLVQDGNPLTHSILSQPSPGGANASGSTTGPVLMISASVDGTFSLTWNSPAGRQYQIESTDGPSLPQWSLVTNGTGEGGPVHFSIKIEVGTSRYYRVKLL